MTIASLSRYDPIKGCFVLKDLDPKPPANPFEWMRFTEEEKERRGGQPLLSASDYKRSTASTKMIEKKRETEPQFGTLGISNKTAAVIAMKPKSFTIYSKAQLSKGKKI
jgi:hypothetical protein